MKKQSLRILAIAATALFIWGLTQIPYEALRRQRMWILGVDHATGFVRGKRVLEHPLRYVVDYTFVGPSGLRRDNSCAVIEDAYLALAMGDAVRVTYAKGNPSLNEIPGATLTSFEKFLRDWTGKP